MRRLVGGGLRHFHRLIAKGGKSHCDESRTQQAHRHQPDRHDAHRDDADRDRAVRCHANRHKSMRRNADRNIAMSADADIKPFDFFGCHVAITKSSATMKCRKALAVKRPPVKLAAIDRPPLFL